ncbi:hypothetical protein D9758_002845 [Tetrapyrgos nigripes]|uniref:Late embryogenesis abundant protein LEA-2 subgroup domain-containing protein n=1 Tax=Tetrapyrgos nigripes TaxID=182062 RepID=A0A8H5LTI6_9AGAR|nr:hypothetical protein D9758_002845 [Tetrapyrgos nigripes]
MSYNDPYAGGQYAHQYQHGQQYNQGGYEFNPYSNSIPHSPPPIPQSPPFSPAHSGPKHAPTPSLSGPFAPYHDDPNPFQAGNEQKVDPKPNDFVDYTAGENSFKGIKDYRSHYQGNLWTRGSRVGCFGRFFGCTLFIAIYLFLAIVGCMILWLRPPSVDIGDPFVNTTQSLGIENGALTIPLGLNVSVNNPMYLSVRIRDLNVDLTYPITNNPNVGNGSISDVNIKSNEETNFTLPIDLDASLNGDGIAVLRDIANKCGSSGGKLDVDADIHIKLAVLGVPVSFSISRSLSFSCPAFAQDALQQISSIIGNLFSK